MKDRRDRWGLVEVSCETSGCLGVRCVDARVALLTRWCASCSRAAKSANSLRHRRAHKGRKCSWCGLTDSETGWSASNSECGACQRARGRGQCQRCHAPLCRGGQGNSAAAKGWCTRCDPPRRGMVPVVLVSDSDDRERIVYRRGGVKFSGRIVREGIVICDPAVWRRVRR